MEYLEVATLYDLPGAYLALEIINLVPGLDFYELTHFLSNVIWPLLTLATVLLIEKVARRKTSGSS